MRVVVAFLVKLAKHRTIKSYSGYGNAENKIFYLRSKILEKPQRNFPGVNFLRGYLTLKTVNCWELAA